MIYLYTLFFFPTALEGGGGREQNSPSNCIICFLKITGLQYVIIEPPWLIHLYFFPFNNKTLLVVSAPLFIPLMVVCRLNGQVVWLFIMCNNSLKLSNWLTRLPLFGSIARPDNKTFLSRLYITASVIRQEGKQTRINSSPGVFLVLAGVSNRETWNLLKWSVVFYCWRGGGVERHFWKRFRGAREF